MSTQTEFTDADTQKAIEIWDEYQKTHDVSALHGSAVGIEPKSGRVFFGDTATDIMIQREKAEGVWEPMFFLRVGFDYYQRKGPRGR